MNSETRFGIENIQKIKFDKLDKDFSFLVNGKIYLKQVQSLHVF